jgi:hypothetical protein
MKVYSLTQLFLFIIVSLSRKLHRSTKALASVQRLPFTSNFTPNTRVTSPIDLSILPKIPYLGCILRYRYEYFLSTIASCLHPSLVIFRHRYWFVVCPSLFTPEPFVYRTFFLDDFWNIDYRSLSSQSTRCRNRMATD